MLHSFIVVLSLTAIWSSVIRPADGIRMLLVVGNMNSHVIQLSRLGVDLAKLGHDVLLLAPSNSRVPDFVQQQQQLQQQQMQFQERQPQLDDDTSVGRFNYTTFDVGKIEQIVNLKETSEKMMDVALTKSTILKYFKTAYIYMEFFKLWDADGRRLLANKDLIDELRSRKFQFVIIDPIAFSYFIVPNAIGDIPYAMMFLGSTAVEYRVPRLPSFTVSTAFDSGDPVTSFTTRLINLAAEVTDSFIRKVKRVDREDDGFRLSSPLYLHDAIIRTSLSFYIEDIAVGYPLPQMPNTIAIGDIAAGRPGLPLPDRLERFVSAATRGVVVMSFGSYFDYIPDGITHKFCDAFDKLQADGIGVVWKSSRSDLCAGVGNVYVTRWIPQNDLLADQRVLLFISHGGFNGLVEAVYHAKPVIVFPLITDQPSNAYAAVKNGYGIRMEIGDFTTDLLLANINSLLSDRKYVENAKRWSSILRDRRDTPAERVSRAIEHVIKYGDSHLRSGAYELNTLQFFMFDVYTVICTGMLICVLCLTMCCRCLYQKSRRRGQTAQSKKRKTY